jgi:hypothetical protein
VTNGACQRGGPSSWQSNPVVSVERIARSLRGQSGRVATTRRAAAEDKQEAPLSALDEKMAGRRGVTLLGDESWSWRVAQMRSEGQLVCRFGFADAIPLGDVTAKFRKQVKRGLVLDTLGYHP